MLINDDRELMLVLRAREHEPEDPAFLFDGEEALLYRSPDEVIKLVNIGEEPCAILYQSQTLLVAETATASLTLEQNADEQRSFAEEICHSYEVPIHIVRQLPAHQVENSPQPSTSRIWGWLADRFVLTLFWFVVILSAGLIAQQFFGNNKASYDVMASTERGLALVQEQQIKFIPDRVLRIMGADFYRSVEGVFRIQLDLKDLKDLDIKELDLEKIQVIPADQVKLLQLKPRLSDWEQKGVYIVLSICLILSIIGSFVPVRIFMISREAK
jgi:hypothetical protein